MAQRIIQLGHILDHTAPHGVPSLQFRQKLAHPHAPFAADDPIGPATITSGSDSIMMGTHTGTHVDSRSHIARGGRLFDGTTLDTHPGTTGVPMARLPELEPVVHRGVLLDMTRHRGVRFIEGGNEFSPDELHACAERQNSPLRDGDTVLIRTGWDAQYADRSGPMPLPPAPGPGVASAHMLAALRASAVGSDTMPFEAAPSSEPLEVHAILIADHGIQILELMDLRELAAAEAYTFTFVLAPLRIPGATASPVNPLALVDA